MSYLSEIKLSNSFHQLGSDFYSEVEPQALVNSTMVSINHQVADFCGLGEYDLTRDEFINIASGAQTFEHGKPLAMVYAGHQFGIFVPKLGDGRALILGEIEHQQKHFDLCLKGCGLTPYSRHGDGRAVLRSCIREYLVSAALHGLNIPTTHALCIVTGDEKVVREAIEPRAMMIRLSECHIRFGSFEYFYHTNKHHQLRQLLDYTIQRFYPEVKKKHKPYASFFNLVVANTAKMIAKWQAYGFCHGVMNTDNMSILGQTFDFGPFAFLDDYQPGFICNHSDEFGRYAFNQQADVGLWNCYALANSLSGLIDKEDLVQGLNTYNELFHEHYLDLMRAKLGLQKKFEQDQQLIFELLDLLVANGEDYTLFFRKLSEKEMLPAYRTWFEHYRQRLDKENATLQDAYAAITKVNPKYILRTYLAQQAIDKAYQGDFSEVEKLLNIVQQPFAEHPQFEDYAKPPSHRDKGIVLSCSS